MAKPADGTARLFATMIGPADDVRLIGPALIEILELRGVAGRAGDGCRYEGWASTLNSLHPM